MDSNPLNHAVKEVAEKPFELLGEPVGEAEGDEVLAGHEVAGELKTCTLDGAIVSTFVSFPIVIQIVL